MGQNQKKVRTAKKNNLNDDFCDQHMARTDADSMVLKIKLQHLSIRASAPIYEAQWVFYHRRLSQTTTNYELQGEGWATRAPVAQTPITDIVTHNWCTSVFGAILNNFYLVEKKHETSFDIFFHRIQWYLHAWTFCTITYIRLMGRNGTRPSNEPCKTHAKHA